MPVLRPLPPEAVLEAANRAGWTVQKTTRFNWALAKGAHLPLIIPRLGAQVAVEIMQGILHHGDADLQRELYAAASVLSRREHEAALVERLDTETGRGGGEGEGPPS